MKYLRGRPLPDVSNDNFDDLGPAMEMDVSQPARARRSPHIARPSRIDGVAHEPMRPTPQYTSAPVRRAPNYAAPPVAEEEDGVPPVIENEAFTEEDHDLLEQEYEHIAEVERKETQIIAAWSAFEKGVSSEMCSATLRRADTFPQQGRHTGQEWRNYFLKVVKPGMESKLRKAAKASEKKPVVISSEDNEKDIYGVENNLPPLNMEFFQEAQLPSPTPVLPEKSRKISATPAKPSMSARVRAEEEEGRNFVSIPPRDKAVSEDKAAFLEDLRAIARATHKQIEPIQEVLGRQVQLYKLYSTVNDQIRFKGFNYVEENNLWPKIVPYVLGSYGLDRLAAGRALRDLYTRFLVKVGSSEHMSKSEGLDMTPATYFATSLGQPKSAAKAAIKEQAAAPSQAPSSRRSAQSVSNSPQKRANGAQNAANDMVSNQQQRYAKRKPSAGPKHSSAMASNGVASANQSPRKRQKKTHPDSLPEPSRKVVGDTLETFMKNASYETDHGDELTDADKTLLGKLVFFAKEVFDINIEVTGIPICKLYVSLPRFRKIVNKYGGYNTVTEQKLWARVAKDLGYGAASRNAELFTELEEVYGDILKDFDIWQEKVRKERERRSRLPVEEQRRLAERESVVVLRHSPPRGSSRVSQKQTRDISEMANQTVPDTFKRRQADHKGKGKEILDEVPATPEHIYNSSWQSQDASVVKDSQELIELSSDSGSDGTEAFQPINRALFKGRTATPTPEIVEEPETQEFLFMDPDSPSEQLHSEAISAAQSPVRASRKRDSSQDFDDEYDEGAAGGDSDLREYYRRCRASGYSTAVASRSLAYANQDINLAQKIWNTVSRGLPIPDNVPGLWPTPDDDVLWAELPDDDPRMMKLIKKHGREEVEDRRDTLQMLGEQGSQ